MANLATDVHGDGAPRVLFRRETVCIADGFLISGLEAVRAADYAAGGVGLTDTTALSRASGSHEFKTAIETASARSTGKIPAVFFHDENVLVTSAFFIFKNELHDLSEIKLTSLTERPFPTVRIDLSSGKHIEHRAMVGEAPREIKAALEKAIEFFLAGSSAILEPMPVKPQESVPADTPAAAETAADDTYIEQESTAETESVETAEIPEKPVQTVPAEEKLTDLSDYTGEEPAGEVITFGSGGEGEPEWEKPPADFDSGEAAASQEQYQRRLTTVLDVRAPGGGEGESSWKAEAEEKVYYRGRVGFVTNKRVFGEGRIYYLRDIAKVFYLPKENKKVGCTGSKPGCIWIWAILMSLFIPYVGIVLGIILLVGYYSMKNQGKMALDSVELIFRNTKTVSISDKPSYQGELQQFCAAIEQAIDDSEYADQ